MTDNYPSEGERAIAAEESTVAAQPPSAAYLRAEAARLLEAAGEAERAEARALLLAREAARPKMPEVGEGPAYVVFRRYQAGREYAYAAVGWREGRSVRWAVTGAETRRFNWPGLLEFIGEANWSTLWTVTAADRLGPEPGAEPPTAEVMGRFGRVERSETVGQTDHDPFAGMLIVGLGGSPFDRQDAPRGMPGGGGRGGYASGGYVHG
ncbi:hypothetical protein CG91_gp092 [Mycobacterium phage 39HC]|uniref:hypothetical protein n=1 Tax=Mycobacterium phage 39HC TaxID=1463809 RepID=UPI0003F21913|nr:hypothetical protein CG91_gp092 [Mycobacterium phage 39HC]AHJ88392.1 hypothetical protein 39HC_092 [Mycobacterium phage 39HC]AHJ88492.1 hypothetical protein 40BC_092 [Mycobacterium phage 40BC]